MTEAERRAEEQREFFCDRRQATFDQWVYDYFKRAEGYWNFVARQQRNADAWIGLLRETSYMRSQVTGTNDFKRTTEDFNVDESGDFLYVYAVFYDAHGEKYEPTEGMVIQISTGEMSYI